MSTDFIESAAAIIDRLRRLDMRRVVFGASRHGYRFSPPLEPGQVEAFESEHGFSFPTPYRRFVTELGNGGPGPFYGLSPLDLEAPELREPFPYTGPTAPPEDDADAFWETEIPGVVTVAEYGCGIYFVLVVRGESAGQVWVDARYETGIAPFTPGGCRPLTFDAWWIEVMGGHLNRFERVLALMGAGIAHEEIHRRLEPGVLQLEVDETMLSLMDRDPTAKPRVYANKPWGQACGLVEDHYPEWLSQRGLARPRP